MNFASRHIGPNAEEQAEMLKLIGYASLQKLSDAVVPTSIQMKSPLRLDPAMSEPELLEKFRARVSQNRVLRSMIGQGYSDTHTPGVILRNILENPGWYTQYTPYQAEISQGRLEALLNFQTMIMDLTGLPIANASLLDEGTAAAEAMAMAWNVKGRPTDRAFWISEDSHPQTIAIVQTRAKPLGIRVVVGAPGSLDPVKTPLFAAMLQYPSTEGLVRDDRAIIAKLHGADALAIVAADLLALMVLQSPGELGADIAIGSAQRLGVPLGFGGPHAAYMSTKDEFKRLMPGRIIGVSKDTEGRPAYRLALQTREQHIRRDKATSNICTAQVLLAIMSSMYAVYHGPKGLRAIAERVHRLTAALAAGLEKIGFAPTHAQYFDTLKIQARGVSAESILKAGVVAGYNFRAFADGSVGIALDETTTEADLDAVLRVFGELKGTTPPKADTLVAAAKSKLPSSLARTSAYLTHGVFNRYHSETEMLRYITRLQGRDLSLAQSMIPLGSCTMKLNATSEMIPVSWPEISRMHPFAPADQTRGYASLVESLEKDLAEITGFSGVSLQPNAGSQGEYAGLLVIRRYLESKNQGHRDVCLIPTSAHGTNPASAAMAGMRVVPVQCDELGNVRIDDLKAKAQEHASQLAALMVTYPSTHGVFEQEIRQICSIVHQHGGQVYMDGANMNAQVGLCRPGDFGADVCHLNLHKTFCIPHGGGGPGMGPICVASHLKAYLPTHPVVSVGNPEQGMGPVSAAPWGSASILPISWMYIHLMGPEGLKEATQVAILNANYLAKRLEAHYPVLYRGASGLVAHECIFDTRGLKTTSGIEVEDIAKRLMDYGYHAPTISFPVPGTLMVEPTESESKAELDRFCEAMIAIREEIREVESGKADRSNNVLKNAPHTATQVTRDNWDRPYSREKAVFPAPWTRESKFWPAVARIDNVYGDRNLVCACPPMSEYS